MSSATILASGQQDQTPTSGRCSCPNRLVERDEECPGIAYCAVQIAEAIDGAVALEKERANKLIASLLEGKIHPLPDPREVVAVVESDISERFSSPQIIQPPRQKVGKL